jgi:hypothetical protein
VVRVESEDEENHGLHPDLDERAADLDVQQGDASTCW